MLRTRCFICFSVLIAGLLATGISAQQSMSQTAGVPSDSGLKAVKSKWYRHVAMMTMPIISASTATMGVPANSGLSGGGFGSRRGFMYEAKIKNEGTREVKGIHWDHVFIDPKDGSIMRRFHFVNDRQTIKKGKTVTLQRMSGHPPSAKIDVDMLGKDAGPQYIERIDIKCVLYKDNVFWYSAEATMSECAYLLRKLKKPTK